MSLKDYRRNQNVRRANARMRREARKRDRQERQPYMAIFRVVCAMLGGHWPVENIYTHERICARCRQRLDKYGKRFR